MYARSYFYIALGLLVGGVLLNQPALTTLAVLAATSLGIAWGWQRACLTGVTYTRHLSEDHVFWGEAIALDVAITNFKLLPLSWLEAEELFPRQLQFEGESPPLTFMAHDAILVHATALRWFERIHWRYEITCQARGLYLFGPVTLRSGDIFGLFTRETQQSLPARLWVYPRVLPLAALGLPPRHPFGDLRAQRQLLEDPLRTAGVREYRPEDPFKRVHWKATARTQQLQVRVYDQTTTHTLMLFLNIESFVHIYEGIETTRAEWGIVVAASLAQYAAGQRWSFGLVSNAPAADGGEAVRLPPSRSPGQLTHMLENLARMIVYPVRGFAEVLRTESMHLPFGSTVVAICPVLPDPARSALLRLRDRGLRVVVCALTDAPPAPLPGLLVYHVPPPAQADYLQGAAASSLGRPAAAPGAGAGLRLVPAAAGPAAGSVR